MIMDLSSLSSRYLSQKINKPKKIQIRKIKKKLIDQKKSAVSDKYQTWKKMGIVVTLNFEFTDPMF